MVIYGLIDPRSGEIRYIGKSVKPAHYRLQRHLSDCLRADTGTYCNRWLRSLLKLGLVPILRIIQRCSSRLELSMAEQWQIAQFLTRGASLTNCTRGGDGGAGSHTPESKAKISQALRGKKKSPEHIRKAVLARKGYKPSAVTRARMRASSHKKRRPWSEAHRIKLSRARHCQPFLDQFGNRYETQNDAARKLHLNLGHLNDVLHGQRKSVGGYTFQFLRIQQFPVVAGVTA